MSNSIIKYRINSVTSQSPDYPAHNLSDQEVTMGWQSQYSPVYPQQINVQFFTPIRTKTLKLTFHQYKIPSCVQLFVRLTTKQNYRKLGFIIPNQNSQSSYQHKQIKTLYFEFPCNYIKLVFYQNFKNQMNLLEQVGLDDLVIQGQTMTYNEIRNLDLTEDQETSDDGEEPNQIPQLNQPRLPLLQPNGLEQTSNNDQLNTRFNQVYAQLQSQKSQAVQNQDFQLAVHLKNAIKSFKDIQSDIDNLQFQKRQALQEQDFDKCHRIKQQLSMKKQQFDYRLKQFISNEQNFMAEYSHSRIQNDIEPSQQITGRKAQDIKDYLSSTPERQPQKYKSLPLRQQSQQQSVSRNFVDHNEQILPAVRNKLKGIRRAGQNQYATERSYQEDENRVGNNKSSLNKKGTSKSPVFQHKSPRSPTRHLSLQNQNICSPVLSYQQPLNIKQTSHQMKMQQQAELIKQTQLPQLEQQRFKHLDLEPLDLKLRMKLESHFNVILQPYWQMIMHKNWKVKKQALQYVRDNLPIASKQSYMAAMQFISFSINDNHTQVSTQTLRVLRKIIEEGNENQVIFTLPHMPYFIGTIITSLLTMINSTNKQLAEQSYNLYLLLGMINFFSIHQLIQKLIRHKQTTKMTPQYQIVKIKLIISIIQKYSQATKSYKDVVQWVINFLQDPNHKVRSQASQVLFILTDMVGKDKILNVIKDKPDQIKNFNLIFDNGSIANQSKVENTSRFMDQNSRVVDKEQSRLEENSSGLGGKSRQRQNKVSLGKNVSVDKNISVGKNVSAYKNASQAPENASRVSEGQQQSERSRNPWNQNKKQELHKLGSFNSLNGSQQRNSYQQLQYSKQSDFYGSSIKKQPSNVIPKIGYSNRQLQPGQHQDQQEQLNVSGQSEERQPQSTKYGQDQDQGDEDEDENDPGKCDFCFMDLHGLDQRTHLMTQCKVIAYCQECMGRIYIRQIIQHLLYDCHNKTHHQQCKKCGLVFNINEINEHVGQGLCRLQRGQGWERCQFCGQDVIATDTKWIQHSYKCPNLPQPPTTQTQNATQRYSETGDQ